MSSSSEATASPEPSKVDCKAERINLLRTIKPVVYADAPADSKPDTDPTTFEIFYVKSLSKEESHISDDGQAIYIAESSTDQRAEADIAAQAIDRQLVLKLGNVCPASKPKA